LASGADIAGDWVYYVRVTTFGSDFDKYDIPLLAFAAVSSLMGALLLWSLYLDYRCRCKSKNDVKWGRLVGTLLGLEMILEDIPQFILTALISAERQSLDPFAVFNLSTSGTNFFLNLLDMIELKEDEDNSDAKEDGDNVEDSEKFIVPGVRR
jgi:hypothetical protein